MTNPDDYTPQRLAVDLAVKVTKLVERLEKAERVVDALKTQRANPHSARAQFELDNALKAAQ